METISLHKFYFDALVLNRKNPSWRYGQAMLNHLANVRPDLFEQVCGTNNDPFYCSSPMDECFDNFIKFIEENWR
jgi:hypothetical protein